MSHHPSEAVLQRVLASRDVLENLPDVVSVLDRHMTLLYLNRTISGRDATERVGTSVLDSLSREHRGRFREAFELAWNSGTTNKLELATLNDTWWQCRFIPFKEAGAVELMLVMSLDTTERVRAERALRESESRLRHAMELVGMGTWTHDLQTDLMAMDDGMRAIVGRPDARAPLSLEQHMRLVHPEDQPRVRASVEHALATGTFSELELRVVRPSGEVRHVLTKGTATLDEQGRPRSVFGAFFDITTRKRLEDQLYQGQKMEAVGQLTAGIAHNFNNVLSVILPNVALCVAEASAAQADRLLEIERAAQRAAELVRQLMLFSRRDVEVHKRSVDPLQIVRRTADICRTTFDKSIDLEVIAEQPLPAVLTMESQLEQVLLNICLNARDALEGVPQPRITLQVSRSEHGGVVIRITDNGPGMDEQTRARIFEPFFTTKPVGRGTGLGLASAYAIVREHGGRISCESTLGAGASFVVELPAAQAGAPQRLQPSASSDPLPHGSETVLLVDDELPVRRATRAMLERGGYQVLEAADGASALSTFEAQRTRIALIILDRSMPGMSGDQLFSELRARGCDAPIVLFSGQVVAGPTARLAAAVLTKPVAMTKLLSTLRDVLDKRPGAASHGT